MSTDSEALERCPLFSNLPRETLSRVARLAVRRTYASEETIILEGYPCQAAYFIAEGHVRVLRTAPDGREQVLSRLGPGRSFNTVPPFRPGGVNHATAEAMDQTTLFAIPAEDFRRLVSNSPALALALLQEFADRVDHLTDLVEDLSLRTVRGRLARFLLLQAEADAVTRQWTQVEIAAQLGTVREMVGRTLRSFAEEGLIRMARHRIELLDPGRLKAEAYE